MSKSERYSRLIVKRTQTPGVVPTAASLSGGVYDHTSTPAWSATDLYPGEFYVNLIDRKLWINTLSGVTEVPLANFSVPPVDGEGLVYNGATGLWTNRTAIGSVHDLSGLTDVNMILPFQTGQFFRLGTSRWENKFITLNDISGVTVSSPGSGEVLTYNGTRWINSPITDVDIANLDDLTDVVVSLPLTGQVLRYNGTNWVNVANSIALTGLTDVLITTPSINQFLKYNGTKWVNSSASLSLTGLTDILLTSPSTGQFLKYSGGTWINATLPSTTSSTALSGLTDVTIVTPTTGQILKYSGGTWKNLNNNLSSLNDVSTTTLLTGQTLKYGTGGTWINSYEDNITGLVWDKYDQKLTINTVEGGHIIPIEGRPIDYITGNTTLDKGYYTVLCYSGVIVTLPPASGYSATDKYYGTVFKIKLITSGSTTITCQSATDTIFDSPIAYWNTGSPKVVNTFDTITLQSDGSSIWYII